MFTESCDDLIKKIAGFALIFSVLSFAVPVEARDAPVGFSSLVADLLPSVVNVQIEQVSQAEAVTPFLFDFQAPPGSPLEQFLEEFRRQQERNRGQRRTRSEGSGFIISPDGHIVTNNHVIGQGGKILVVMQDETEYEAELLGRDSQSDLALLKIDALRKLPALPWGDSDKAEVGDWVIAIGNPLGLGGSVTAGIVSARGRNIRSGPYDDFIQTDAPINHGNSGGPLFNVEGEVIGINTAIFSPNGGSIGIAFAIPSNFAKLVTEQLRNFGETRRGWLGVVIQEVTQEIAESLGLGDIAGALISEVQPASPAAESGLRPGDVILELDGKPIRDSRRLSIIVAGTEINKQVKVDLWRNNRKIPVFVRIGKLPNAQTARRTPQKTRPKTQPARGKTGTEIKDLGLRVSNLNAGLRQKFALPNSIMGVVVVDVAVNSDAANKGIIPGIVITEINQKKISDTKKLQSGVSRVRALKRKAILLRVVDSRRRARYIGLNLQ